MDKADLLNKSLDAVVDRDLEYGNVKTNFKQIADYWSLHLRNRHGMAIELTAEDFVAMMILMKVARLDHNPGHVDSLIDISGYSACWADLIPDAITPDMFGPAKEAAE